MQEFKHLGFNVTTIGFLGIVAFAIVEAYGFWKQAKSIYDNRSGQSVSVLTWTYMLGYFVSSIIYGVFRHSMAITFNGAICALPLLLLCFWLWRYKGFAFWENVSCIGMAIFLAGMIIGSDKGLAYLLISLGTITAGIWQAVEIQVQKSVGVTKLETFLVLEASTIFWIAFGYATRDWVLEIICPPTFVILAVTIGLWLRHRNTQPVPVLLN